MPEEVVEKTVPQLQPGPERTPDGTIKDQSPAPQTTETKSTETPAPSSTKTDSSATEKKDGEPVFTGAPEKYEDFKLPDGFKLDPEAVTAATEIFKKANLSQDGAQQLIDFHAKQLQAAQEAPFKAFVDMKKGWTDAVNTKYGKDIAEGGKHFVAVGGLLEQLGDLEAPFRTAMDETGVGSHPAFVDAFIKLASMLGSGTHVKGNGPSPLGQSDPSKPAQRSLAQAMYPHLPSAG
jgi:hypothetical protein